VSATLDDYYRSLRNLQRDVMTLTAAEMNLAEENSSAKAVNVAEDAVALAARALTTAVDMKPRAEQPKGWNS